MNRYLVESEMMMNVAFQSLSQDTMIVCKNPRIQQKVDYLIKCIGVTSSTSIALEKFHSVVARVLLFQT